VNYPSNGNNDLTVSGSSLVNPIHDLLKINCIDILLVALSKLKLLKGVQSQEKVETYSEGNILNSKIN
jgi:hypothetical protein